MQEKKNVPSRPHTVRNVAGSSYKFLPEIVIEVCISGLADCRFFVICVLLCPKIWVSFNSFPSSAQVRRSENYCWVPEFHNRNYSRLRGSGQHLWILEGKQSSTSYSKTPKYQEVYLLTEMPRCPMASLTEAWPAFFFPDLCFLSHRDLHRLWGLWV